MQQITQKTRWLYQLKRNILLGIASIISITLLIIAIFLVANLKKDLLEESRNNTKELASAIHMSIRSLMIMRNPQLIQNTIEQIKTQKSQNEIVGIKILDDKGKVVYSTNKEEINEELDSKKDPSCIPCHKDITNAPFDNSIMMEEDNRNIQRIVTVLYNDTSCYQCHPKSQKINGVLIIDRDTKGTEAFISHIQWLVLISGLICLTFLIGLITYILTKHLNRYIKDILEKNMELNILYEMMGKLNKTIDIEELRALVIEILSNTLDADEIDIITKRDSGGFRCISWNKKTNSMERKKLDDKSPQLPLVMKWDDGKIKESILSDDGREIYVPIIHNEVKLGMIIIRKKDTNFDPNRLNLLNVIKNHIAVAFANARLYYLAITDELTKLYTQRHFRFCLDREFLNYQKYGEKFTLLMCDLDNFKKVNDTMGHLTGDMVLYGVATTISNSIRDNDLAFRYGGEEFTVLLPSTDLESEESLRKG